MICMEINKIHKWVGAKPVIPLDKASPFYNEWKENDNEFYSLTDGTVCDNTVRYQTMDTYYETFVGSGGVFFSFLNRKINKYFPQIFKRAILSDVNPALINHWLVVRDNFKEYKEEVDKIKWDYQMSDNKQQFYLSSRNEFNRIGKFPVGRNIRLAVLFIFLNKTCFNGLYRLNRSGQFNVGWNKVQTPVIDLQNMKKISDALNKYEIIIEHGFYKDILNKYPPTQNDFCYFDPPYEPVVDGGFTTYDGHVFTYKDQQFLHDYVNKLDCDWLLSNSNAESIEKLYAKNVIHKIFMSRRINSDASNRRGCNEVLISNYLPYWCPCESVVDESIAKRGEITHCPQTLTEKRIEKRLRVIEKSMEDDCISYASLPFYENEISKNNPIRQHKFDNKDDIEFWNEKCVCEYSNIYDCPRHNQDNYLMENEKQC